MIHVLDNWEFGILCPYYLRKFSCLSQEKRNWFEYGSKEWHINDMLVALGFNFYLEADFKVDLPKPDILG